AHQTEEPEPIRELNPAVSARLAAVVERLLSKQPDERFFTTDELVEAFRTLASKPSELLAEVKSRSAALMALPAPKSSATKTESRPAAETIAGGLTTRALVGAGLAIGAAFGTLLAWFLTR